MRFKQGQPVGALKKIGAGARHAARRCSSVPTRRSSRRSSSTPRSSSSGSRSRATCTRACKIVFEDEANEREARLPAHRGARRLSEDDPARAHRDAGARGAVHAVEGQRRERPAARPRAAVDAVDRRARAQLRQRHPDRIGRHARERLPRRARQGGAQLHRDAQPLAQRRHADGGGHSRGARRACSACSSPSRSSRGRRRIA